MDYLAKIKGLCNEICQKVHYKEMSKGRRILAYIGMFPFFMLNALLIVNYYVLVFFFNCSSSAADFLLSWVKETKKDLKHATEAVLYFVTMPTIFLMQVFLSLFAPVFYILWFVLMLSSYVSTLGGIRFQPFIATATFEDDGMVLRSLTPKNTSAGFAAMIFTLLCAVIVLCISVVVTKFIVYNGNNISYDTLSSIGTIIGIRNVFVWFYVLVAIVVPLIIFKKEKVLEEESR